MAIDDEKEYIVLYTHQRLSINAPEVIPSSTVDLNKMVFRINYEARREQFKIPYVFDAAYGNIKLSQYEVHEVLPLPPNEPNENVNLDNLKTKLRDNINLKQLLQKYYANERNN